MSNVWPRRFALFATLFLVFIPILVSAQSLEDIEQQYDQSLIWYTALGERPLVFEVDSIQRYEAKNQQLRDYLHQLKSMDEQAKDTRLWQDLMNFTLSHLQVRHHCQPGVWDYVMAYEIRNIFRDSLHRISFLQGRVIDRTWALKTLDLVDEVLDIYIEKMQVSLDKQLLPSSWDYMFGMNTPEQLRLSIEDLNLFLDEFETTLCSNCSDGDMDPVRRRYEMTTLKKVNRFLEGLREIESLAQSTVFRVPAPIAQACYTAVIASVSGERLTPEAMLELGHRELRKAESQMLDILGIDATGADETNRALLIQRGMEQIIADLEPFHSAEEYLAEANAIMDHIEPFLGQISSHRLPRAKIVDVNEPTNKFVVFYDDADGEILLNSQAMDSRMSLASTIIHEGLPGHHLERGLNYQRERSSSFYHNLPAPEYIEGWAYYVEELADELGMYRNDAERLGYLDFVRVRALRLIIPYLFFFKGLSYEDAEAYIRQHSLIEDFRVNSELARMRRHDGQVLSYLVGKDLILRKRAKAKKALGNRFSLVAFHDFILSLGAIHVKTFENELDRWIERQSNTSSTKQ